MADWVMRGLVLLMFVGIAAYFVFAGYLLFWKKKK